MNHPTYSHGGSANGLWPAVVGTATGPGRPVSIEGAVAPTIAVRPVMQLFCKGTAGTMTVSLQCCGGALNSSGVPPSDEWQTAATITFSAVGQTDCRKLMLTHPFWRTNVIARTGDADLVSYVPRIHVHHDCGATIWTSATYPSVAHDGTLGA